MGTPPRRRRTQQTTAHLSLTADSSLASLGSRHGFDPPPRSLVTATLDETSRWTWAPQQTDADARARARSRAQPNSTITGRPAGIVREPQWLFSTTKLLGDALLVLAASLLAILRPACLLAALLCYCGPPVARPITRRIKRTSESVRRAQVGSSARPAVAADQPGARTQPRDFN